MWVLRLWKAPIHSHQWVGLEVDLRWVIRQGQDPEHRMLGNRSSMAPEQPTQPQHQHQQPTNLHHDLNIDQTQNSRCHPHKAQPKIIGPSSEVHHQTVDQILELTGRISILWEPYLSGLLLKGLWVEAGQESKGSLLEHLSYAGWVRAIISSRSQDRMGWGRSRRRWGILMGQYRRLSILEFRRIIQWLIGQVKLENPGCII